MSWIGSGIPIAKYSNIKGWLPCRQHASRSYIIQAWIKKSIEVEIGEILTARGLTLAAAESCTGGLVSHRITNVPGSSVYFVGGVVSYANAVKIALVGVRPQTLEMHGAVSRETVIEMARGVRVALKADIGSLSAGLPDRAVGLPKNRWA